MLNRLKDLAKKRDSGNYCLFSPFLSPDILPDAQGIGNICFSGGYEDAERCMMAFLPDYMSEEDLEWPISLLKVRVSDKKCYNHRDYLGSLMALGIKRQVIGDIIVCEENAFVFCQENIEEFIVDNLTHIAGTSCKVEKVTDFTELPQKRFEDLGGTVASERLDCVVALAIKSSRTKAADFISAGFVTVNYKEALKPTYIMKEGDRFSIRGKGKFIYDGSGGNTKKGRTIVKIRKYV